MMFLKYRYRLGYEPLCREVSDSIAWRRFCRVPLDRPAPHPTTLMKITSRCGERAVAGLNDALLDKAAENKVVELLRHRSNSTYPDPAIIPMRQASSGGKSLSWWAPTSRASMADRDNYRPSRKASSLSGGRKRPGVDDGGVVRARARSLMVMSAWR